MRVKIPKNELHKVLLAQHVLKSDDLEMLMKCFGGDFVEFSDAEEETHVEFPGQFPSQKCDCLILDDYFSPREGCEEHDTQRFSTGDERTKERLTPSPVE